MDCGLWKSDKDKEWNTKGVADMNLSMHSDVERLNEGVNFIKYQYLGVGKGGLGLGYGCNGSKSMPVEDQPKALRIPRISTTATGESQESDVPFLVKMIVKFQVVKGEWNWINIGILFVSIVNWISEFMFARCFLNTKEKMLGMYDRGGQVVLHRHSC